MKILELGKFYAPERGGIETVLRIWSEGFVRAGHSVDCVVAHRQTRSLTEVLHGVRVHRLASFGSAMSTSLAPRYLRATHRHPADVWHAHYPNPLADLACVTGPKRVPLVVHWHSDIIRQKALMHLYAPLVQDRLLRRADRIVVATPLHLQHSRWLGPYRDKVQVIPFGLELERFKATPAVLDRAAEFRKAARVPGRKILLNVGRLVGYKGQHDAIRAMRELDAELWLAGDGPLRTELQALAAECGVADKVQFWGEVSDADLPALLHACDVFVFPSVTTNEAFGLVLVEAMACRKPLVACDLKSGVPFVCAHGSNGLICQPRDPSGLAAMVQKILQNPDLASRLGQAGFERAHREFSASVMVSRTLELFAEVTSRRNLA